jgi:malate dehydrogenase (quinone)
MKNVNAQADIVLIGAGIMSATLGMFLKELDPSLSIIIIERLDKIGAESSDAWNNAGTGHSAFCELNYTPEKPDGSVDISKALKIAAQFETSKEFWAYLIEHKKVNAPHHFINTIPHMSFVWGADNVFYLKKRFDAMSKHKLFDGMVYTNKWGQIEKWVPLMMEGRDPGIEVAATRMEIGTDVNFGELTREIFSYLEKQPGVQLYLNHEVRDIEREGEHMWNLTIHDMIAHDKHQHIHAKFAFIGAGGGSLPLLEKSDIPEAEGFGGFPVSGQWLRCTNEKIIARHSAKVYGKASVGSPPMSVPHLDTRIIDGKKALLFGPYAGFSTKFLKNGSYWDLTGSIEVSNLFPMLSAGWHNMPLTRYLIKQASQSQEDRMEALREYFPDARMEDWELAIAGQRVQVIKKDEEEGGKLEFGTEIVACADGTLAALLGASPGASTSVSIMLDVLKKCFKDRVSTPEWQAKLKEMIPSYGQSFVDKPELVDESRKRTSKILFPQTADALV